MHLFINTFFNDPAFFLAWVLVVTFSICVHEYAHAYVAYRLGDRTAALRGHLTLNPLKQMGPTSLIMLLVAGIAWGAVPINPMAYRNRSEVTRMAIAGPVANLLLCAIFAFLTSLALKISAGDMSGPLHPARFFELGARANGVLFLFNLLPLPMLDGWAVVALLVNGAETWRLRHGQQLSLFLLMLVFFTPAMDWIWSGGAGLSSFLVHSAGKLLGLGV